MVTLSLVTIYHHTKLLYGNVKSISNNIDYIPNAGYDILVICNCVSNLFHIFSQPLLSSGNHHFFLCIHDCFCSFTLYFRLHM